MRAEDSISGVNTSTNLVFTCGLLIVNHMFTKHSFITGRWSAKIVVGLFMHSTSLMQDTQNMLTNRPAQSESTVYGGALTSRVLQASPGIAGSRLLLVRPWAHNPPSQHAAAISSALRYRNWRVLQRLRIITHWSVGEDVRDTSAVNRDLAKYGVPDEYSGNADSGRFRLKQSRNNFG